jgi:hypothetical protein
MDELNNSTLALLSCCVGSKYDILENKERYSAIIVRELALLDNFRHQLPEEFLESGIVNLL